MKKLLIIALLFSLCSNFAEAKDYAKLQIKEMKHAQKYGTTQKVLQNQNIQLYPKTVATLNIKDPKIMKFGNYEKISNEKYNAKIKADEKIYSEYEKDLKKSASKHYKTQADAADFYRVYRVAENLIRANKLDYLNWRIEIYKDSVSPNAYTTNTNYIAISTSLLDTFGNNEDAMAFVIGHEMGHALLGHQERSQKLLMKMDKQYRLARLGNSPALIALAGMKRKYLIDSKNMEYAADVEGAKLALHAGYNMNCAAEVISYFSSLPSERDWLSDHPNPNKRLENLQENSKYFPVEWKDMGKANIYNSEPMPVNLSSDRKSMVISAPSNKLDASKYYSPETMEELYARFGYMCYVNGEFEKSVNYFNDLFKIDQTNSSAYLYASYASEYLYKNTGNDKYLKQSKEYAQKAYNLDSKNKYIKEQIEAL